MCGLIVVVQNEEQVTGTHAGSDRADWRERSRARRVRGSNRGQSQASGLERLVNASRSLSERPLLRSSCASSQGVKGRGDGAK